MYTQILVFLLALFISAPAWADGPAPGQLAPSFVAENSYGDSIGINDFDGRYVVLEWTNHECPFVQKHYKTGNMQALQKEMRDEGVVWLSIISSAPGKQGHVDGKKANELTMKREAYPSNVLLDESGEVGRLYGAKVTPQIFLIDPEGVVLYSGAIDSIASTDTRDISKATNYLKAAYVAAKAGQPVEIQTSTPYGCQVKYE